MLGNSDEARGPKYECAWNLVRRSKCLDARMVANDPLRPLNPTKTGRPTPVQQRRNAVRCNR
jgi:hypothetical protein